MPSIGKVFFSITVPLWGILVPISVGIWMVSLPYVLVKKVTSLIKGEKIASEIKVEIHGDGTKGDILLLHGWPDCGSLWDKQVPDLVEKGYRCIVATLPGFDGKPVGWGYNFDQLTEMANDVVEANSPSKKVIIYAHDFGCTIGYMLQRKYPEKVQRMIALDVGGYSKPDAAGILFVMSYQFYNLFAWSIGGPAGRFLNTSFLTMGKYRARPLSHCVSSLNYLYPKFLWALATKNMPPFKPFKDIPVFYGYALKKDVSFHAESFLEGIRASKGGKVCSFNCGHWISVSKPDELNKEVGLWLEQTADL
eukprot:TRINITY_DN73_c5_g1_i1.p1 TRINITY_DN73_c5_g1~~TRINITY_DN73_c5_g1_i1.p1  ORF type:complete len:307 (+),score=42.10 TRINITY_DN73_c5_g1_i1:61-981(+)